MMRHYINLFRDVHPPDLPSFACSAKEKIKEILMHTSFPSSTDEAYLYTPVADIFAKKLQICPRLNDDFNTLSDKIKSHSGIPAIDADTVVIHNGYYADKKSMHRLPNGVIFGSYASMLSSYGDMYLRYFPDCRPSDDVLINLNTVLYRDGFFLFIPADVHISQPLHVINLLDNDSELLIQPRHLVIMEKGSAANLLVSTVSLTNHAAVCNDATEVIIGRDAKLNMVRLQNVNSSTHLFTHTVVKQMASSQMTTHTVSLNGHSIRNNLHVTLADHGAMHAARGLALTGQTEHVDNHVQMAHASSGCHSNQLFSQILAGTSTGAFTGRIVVNSGAQKTSAYQRSTNIVLHPEAKMNIRPQLEIYADDVQCSHGATVGQLDAEAIFYLRSRGIAEQEAKMLLLRAFATSVIGDIACEPFRAAIQPLIERKLENMFSAKAYII